MLAHQADIIWRVLASRAQHTERLPEWERLACIAIVMVRTKKS